MTAVNPNAEPKKRKYRSSEKGRRSTYNYHLKRYYGITLVDYERMYEQQNGLCAICSKPGKGRAWKDGRIEKYPLAVDHDHDTGEIRKLLCNFCNVGLAQFRESKEILTSAISYLMEHGK